MKGFALWCLAFLAVSCGLEEVSRRPHEGGDVWKGPGMNIGSGDTDRTVVYVTAMDYPDGYDWRADTEKGSVKCSLVVYADGIPMMKVPVGDAYETSSDPDMHRMSEGHLYTDYSTSTETVIKKDGKEVVRFPGREMICDLVESGGEIHTLGHNRDGDGFTYRINGETVVGRGRGRTFGRFYQNEDEVSFAFREPVAAVGDTLERYYYAVDGEVSQTAVREDVRKVWDIVSHEGEICYLASVVGISAPVLFHSGGMQALNMPESSKMLTSRIVLDGDNLYVEGLCRRDRKPPTSGLWKKDGQIYMFADGMTVSSICMGGDGVCCVLNGTSSRRGIIYRFGETYSMPYGYASVGNSPAAVINGILHVGLSSLIGSQPVLWKDSETTPLKINGFISTISTNRL